MGARIDVSLTDLKWQLLLGSSPQLNPPLWYQADLIILTIIFGIFFLTMKKGTALKVLWILTAVSLALQYSGMNEILFGDFRYEVRYSAGRLVEMVPLATIGLSLAVTPVIDQLKKYWKTVCVSVVVAAMLIAKYQMLGRNTPGFGYGGLCLMVMGSLLFLFAYVLPGFRFPAVVKKIIRQLGKYTFGIYCLHYGVGACMNMILKKIGMNYNTFLECIIIWVICYVVCFILDQIPNRYVKMLVI